MSGFKKAQKSKSKLRLAIYGLSGGGKTFTSLNIAKGFSEVLNERIAVIDSELGSASKYSDRFDFDVLNLNPKKRDIKSYVSAINEAEQAGYKILVVDSLSHAWAELLQEVELIAQARFKGNTWAAWSEGTPKQRQLIDAITSYDGHIIVTMRAKTEYENSKSEGQKQKISRIGLAPEQGKGIEYEFDFLACINQEHILEIQKDRSGKFQDNVYKNPDKEFGIELINWLNDGKEPSNELYEKVKAGIEAKTEGKYDTIENLSKIAETLKAKHPEDKKTLDLIESRIKEIEPK